MEYSIETASLTRVFDGLVAVDKIALHVERGVFYGFLGPNGAGKSTTIRMLTGMLAPSSGAATLLGYDLTRQPLEIKRRIGVVTEESCLFENLTAREYLVFIGRMYGLPRTTLRGRCDELLALMGLDDAPNTLILEFSHGMKKKLGMAAALIHDPELLFLDEPFEGIDAIASRTLRRVLERFVQRERTVFLTSHILEIVEKLCTHVGIIHRGALAAQGRIDALASGASLEDLFIRTVGETQERPAGLSWLQGEGHV